MSSVLHPVGPEPGERYWVRRLAVLVAAVVAIVIVIALVGNAMSAGSAVQAEPAPPSVAAPTLPPTTASASPTPEGSASPTPAGGATPGATTPLAGASAPPTPGSTVSPDPGQTPDAERSTPPTSTEKRKAEQQAAEKKAAEKKAAEKKAAGTKKSAPVLASCPADTVRPTLTGPRTVKAKKAATFELSLINGSGNPCYVKVTSDNFRLTIVSGSDRVWSSADCSKAVPATSRKLAAEKSVDWTMTWDGSRSGSGCTKRPQAPRPGYYVAIANFDDAREVRWRVILT